jgi:hypothetical protein
MLRDVMVFKNSSSTNCGNRRYLRIGHLLLQPHICDVRQTDHGHAYKNKKIAAKQIVPISSNRNSQGEHSPFKNTGLPPFQRERLEYIHASALLPNVVEDPLLISN